MTSWPPQQRVMSVIDGNGKGFVLRSMLEKQFGTPQEAAKHYVKAPEQPEGGNRVSKATKIRWLKELDEMDVVLPLVESGRVGVTCHLLTQAGQSNPKFDTDKSPHARVFAIIRPSLMDFERHSYDTVSPVPTPIPTPIPRPVPRPIPHP